MTPRKSHAPRGAALPAAAIAALLLSGCSSGHVGDSWQCPLARGGSCDSVAAADPAVPDPAAARGTVLGEPLWRVRAAETDATAETPCAVDCGGGFDPIAWLVRLFGGGEAAAQPAGAKPAPLAAAGPLSSPLPENEPPPVREPASPAPRQGQTPAIRGPGQAAGATAPLPAEAGPSRDETARGVPAADDLRIGEIVARIWIAPFVDADGVYREASYIRVVLEPAGWRLPR